MLFSYYRRPLFLLLLVYAAGIYLFRAHLLKPDDALPFALPRSGALIEGRVSQYPVPGRGGVHFALETESVYGRPLKTGLMVYARSMGGASCRDKVSFLADLDEPPGAAMPGGLDWADFLARRGITAQARARDVELTGRANPFIRLARAFHYSALETYGLSLPAESAAVMGGIVLGDNKSVPQGLKTAYQDSGAMHLLIAAGLKEGFVVAIVFFFCSWLGLGRKYCGLAALGISGLYVIAAGFDAPLVRSYLMFSTGLGAYLLKREAGAFHALTVACLAILLFSPRSLFEAGFQMSFLAVYGLCVGMSLWVEYLKVKGFLGKVLELFLVSFFTQLGLYPLLAFYFHKVSLISLFSNIVLVPASYIVMALGFLMAFFSKAGPVFRALAWAGGASVDLFDKGVWFFAELPFAYIRVPEPSVWVVAGYFILAFAVLHAPLFGFRNRRLYAVLALGLGVMAIGPLGRAAVPGARSCRAVLFGDADTSCAFVYANPGGLYIVNPGIDGGKLAEAVFSGGGRTVEGALLTSLERKNFSGLEKLSGLVGIRTVLVPYGPQPPELKRVLAELEKNGTVVGRMWPDLPDGGPVNAFWDGDGPGYTGGSDILGWEIGGVRIGGGGKYAQQKDIAQGGLPARAEAQERKTVTREFFPPGR